MGDLFQITTDPKVQRRVMKADSNNDGRISRKDILKVMQNEATGGCGGPGARAALLKSARWPH